MEPKITRVRVFCWKCYKYHVFEEENLHPQMVAKWFVCPTTKQRFEGSFTRVGTGTAKQVIPEPESVLVDEYELRRGN